MTIRTERLILRPFTMRDLRTTYAYASDPANTEYMLHLPARKKRETRRFLKFAIAEGSKVPLRRHEFAVIFDGKHIGAVSISLDESEREGELGWIIRKAHQGKGYATEAAKAVMVYALDTLGVTKIYARCDYRNEVSRRVMEKIGLSLESDTGIRYYGGSGAAVQELMYSLISCQEDL